MVCTDIYNQNGICGFSLTSGVENFVGAGVSFHVLPFVGQDVGLAVVGLDVVGLTEGLAPGRLCFNECWSFIHLGLNIWLEIPSLATLVGEG